MNRILTILIFCLYTTITIAQQEVVVKVSMNPPYPLNYQELLNRNIDNMVELQNLTNAAQSVQLGFRVFSYENNVSLQSIPERRSPKPIVVPPLSTIRIGSSQMNVFFTSKDVITSGFSIAEIKAKRAVPEGYYYLCFRAYDYKTLKPLGEESCSNPIALMALETPRLSIVNPVYNDTIQDVAVQNLIFQWNTPSNIRANLNNELEYRLKIVEILPGMNENQAIFSAPVFTPEFIIKGTNSFIYDQSRTPLIKGLRYAAVLQVNDPENRFSFRNNGRSEVITFVYGRKNANNTIINNQSANSTADKVNKVIGRAAWAFKDAKQIHEVAQSYANDTSSSLEVFLTNKKNTIEKQKQPLVNAIVQLINACNNQIISTGVTDKEGNFEMKVDQNIEELCKSYYLQIQPQVGATVFNLHKKRIQLQYSSLGYQVEEEVLQAQTFFLSLKLADSSKEKFSSARLFLKEKAWISSPYAQLYNSQPDSIIEYAGEKYIAVTEAFVADELKRIFQNVNGADKYLLKINQKNNQAYFLHLNNMYYPYDKHGNKPTLWLKIKV